MKDEYQDDLKVSNEDKIDTHIHDDLTHDNYYLEQLNLSLAEQVNSVFSENNTIEKSEVVKKNKKDFNKRKIIYFIATIILVSFILVISPLGKKIVSNVLGDYLYGRGFEFVDTNRKLSDIQTNINVDGSSLIHEEKNDDDIINILLIGIEEFKNARNTDSMIIASINARNNTLKLISIMRDIYVDVPGNDNNKLNSVYSTGGINLLYETMESTFGLDIDGYMLVNFESFEKIVDILDGVEVTLTKGEAAYLNKHNYISNPKYRNVVVGTQRFNGNQALGYCRVRSVSTGTENNDFGRTQRQRAVLKSMVNTLKEKNLLDLTNTMNEIVSSVNIKTDITKSDFKKYLEIGLSLKFDDIDNLRIPTDGSYVDQKVLIGKRKQAVLILKDGLKTKEEIRKFIYE